MVTMIMDAHFQLRKTAEMNQSIIIFHLSLFFLSLHQCKERNTSFMCSLKDLTQQFALDLHTQQFLHNEMFASHLCQ